MSVRIVFLGGLGGPSIGRNCLAIEDGDEIIVIDCGLYFPKTRMDGVEVAIPDVTYLRDNADRVTAVFLTHGHEDHIGALQYLLPHLDCPVYGGELTLAIAARRIAEVGIDESRLVPVQDGEVVTTSRMSVEFIPVTHSVPMSSALAITTSEGVILHTGDLKLDPDPIDGRTTDLARFEAIGSDPGVRVLLIDSTNAEEPGTTESERAVHPGLARAFEGAADRRVIATCFASHMHRVAQIIDVATRQGRIIVPVGRSMERTFQIGRELGILTIDDASLGSAKDLDSLPASRVCILCTGSQGEPRAALSLMAEGRHRFIRLSSSDVVIMSSDTIPGNEPEVGHMIDRLVRTGADVIHAGFAKVHVSGHAKRDELREIVERVRPTAVLPVHGEYRHLVHMASLARELPTPPSEVLMVLDGDVVSIDPDHIEVVDRVPTPFVFVSSGEIGRVDECTVHEREELMHSGVLVIGLERDDSGLHLGELRQFGWVSESAFDHLRDALVDLLDQALATAPDARIDLEPYLTRRVGRFAKRRLGVEPKLLVTVAPA
jgi:ribonuclease J